VDKGSGTQLPAAAAAQYVCENGQRSRAEGRGTEWGTEQRTESRSQRKRRGPLRSSTFNPQPSTLITRRHPLGAAGRQFPGAAGRGGGDHWTQWGGEEHTAKDPLPHHRPDQRPGRHPGPRVEPAGSRHRLPPRAHRPGKRLHERHDPRHAEARDRPQVRRDRRLLGRHKVSRYAGEAVFVGHEGASGICGRGAPRSGNPRYRRSAGGGGLRTSASEK
jgi:hypothetical protein